MPEFFITSSRLGFRTWCKSDLPLARRLWGDPAVTRLISRDGYTESEISERLDREIATETQYRIQYWPIFLLSDGAFVGCCGLRPRGEDPQMPELGVHIASAHWRQGYALEAARRVIRHAFDFMGLEALFAGHHPENNASRALLLRLGFSYSHDEQYPPTRLAHPSYILNSVTKKSPNQPLDPRPPATSLPRGGSRALVGADKLDVQPPMRTLRRFVTPKVVRWLAVGVVFAAVGLGLLKLMAGVLGWPYILATLLSGEIGTILRFLVVDRWVFRHPRPTLTRLWQYHVANALGFGIWWSVANLLEAAGVHYLVASVLAMFFSVGVNMLSNFWWIWRKPAVAKS